MGHRKGLVAIPAPIQQLVKNGERKIWEWMTRRGEARLVIHFGQDSTLFWWFSLFFSPMVNERRLGGKRMVGGWMNGRRGHACFWETDIHID
jgi:hypothetical protein